jgi:hypothetical protein
MATADRNDDNDLPQYVTARDLPGFIHRHTGLRVTRGKIKLASAQGRGPPISGRWGNSRLFDAAGSLRWARSLVQPYERKQLSPNLAKQRRARSQTRGITAAE